MKKREGEKQAASAHVGRDEMNLVEFPLGPIGRSTKKTIRVDHLIFDSKSKRDVLRQVVITGSDAYGLPRAIDDQVLIGMKALTYGAKFESRKVFFSRHNLCQILGWNVDGRSYKRIEDSLDRLAGTMLKFKNSWYDKGIQEWRSHNFHLIDNFELCSRDRYYNARRQGGAANQSLCYFVWNEIIWKSFEDGFIKKVDMRMFRKIANGRRRESPLRLYRWLDKKFYKGRTTVKFDVLSLCNGTIGYSLKYPSDAKRAIERSAQVLVDCGFLESFWFRDSYKGTEVFFRKRTRANRKHSAKQITGGAKRTNEPTQEASGEHARWIRAQSEDRLLELETEALAKKFGRKLHHDLIAQERQKGTPILESSLIRQLYIRDYLRSVSSVAAVS